MEQSRFYVCRECSTPVPAGHKFCGACGATVPEDVLHRREEPFGQMQASEKARLVLIRGEEDEAGLVFLLQGKEHIVGTVDAQIPFPNDPWISPRHANFYYRGNTLVVRDEGSHNGVYVRVREPAPILPGSNFLCGEQLFRLEQNPNPSNDPEPDQTYFYSSPKRPSTFRVVQIFAGGAPGMVYCARTPSLQIGREGSEMNFPDDLYMSGAHAAIDMAPDGTFSLRDLGSRNGTYLRVNGERDLRHGDYLFLGQHLLRVEQTL